MAVVSGSATVGGVSFPVSAAITLPAVTIPPPSGAPQCYFGVWDDDSGWPADGVSYSWAGVQKLAATKVLSATYYMSWLAPYPVGLGTLAKANGASLYLNLEPQNPWGGGANPTVPDIAAGRYDAWLTQIGQAIKAGNNVCRVTWAHEMQGNWYPWGNGGSGGVTPAQWVAGWTRVCQVIKAAAGNLAQMTWCPNNADVGPVAPYWPGPALVDVAAFDGYLNQASAGQTYASFVKQTVDQIGKLDGIGALAGQVWNAETGISGTNRSARITQFVRDMHADGRVSGLTWFHEGEFLLQPAELSALTSAVNAWNAG